MGEITWRSDLRLMSHQCNQNSQTGQQNECELVDNTTLHQLTTHATRRIPQKIGVRLFQSMRSKTKVTALATAIGTLPLLAIGTTVYDFANQSISQVPQTQKPQASSFLVNKVSSRLEGYGDIQLAAELSTVINPQIQQYIKVRQRTDNFVEKIDNDYHLVTYIPWKLANGLLVSSWKLILTANKATASASQNNLLQILAIRTVLTVFLVIAIATFLFKWGISPILNANKLVEKQGEGKFNPHIDLKGEDELTFLGFQINLVADQLKVLVTEQAEQSRHQEVQAKRTQLFTAITLRIRQFLSQKYILETTVEELRNLLGTERVVIYRFQEDGHGTVVAESVAAGWTQAINKHIDDPCLMPTQIHQYTNGRVRAVDNIYRAGLTDCYIETLEQFEVKANLVAPIFQDKQLFGFLIAHQCSQPRTWQEWEIDLFTQLTIQVGFALDQAALLEQIENARLYAEVISQEQRQQKEMLQQKLIEMMSSIEAASIGDLTVKAEVTAGEVGIVAEFFNSIIESLRQIVTTVKKAVQEVNASVSDNSGAVQLLALKALKQAEDLTCILDDVHQMTQSIQAVADNAIQAAEVARNAFDIARVSGKAMDRTVQSILNLQETVTQTANKVNLLGESSQKISLAVSLINQIAVQTNLLSINASLEMARAGDQSQGFTVVAEEIGELAAQSAEATREIQQILENIELGTSEVVKAMELGRTQVVEGANLVKDAKLSLEQILELSQQIDQLVQSISNATVSQAQTSQSVTILIKEVAEVSKSTSDCSEIVSSSLQKTLEVGQQLHQSASIFKTDN
jgi:twitching motility protein PilJ